MLLSDIEYGWKKDITDEQYFGNKTAVNSTSLKKILKSPAAFYSDFFLGQKDEPTDALRFGKLAHMAILEGHEFSKRYVVMPKFTGYTRDGKLTDSLNCTEVKNKRSQWMLENSNNIICSEEERDHLIGMINSIIKHERAFKLLSKGVPEAVGYWRDKTGINCKLKADFISFDLNTLVDIKTIVDTSEETCQKHMQRYQYYFQACHYREGLKAIAGKFPDYTVHIFIEKKPPYEVVVYEMGIEFEEIGHYEHRLCMEKLKSCLEKNEWPFRQREVEILSPNEYFINQYKGLINGN